MVLSRYSEMIDGRTRKLRRPGRRAHRKGLHRFWPGAEGLEDRTVLTFLTPVSYVAGTTPTAAAVGDFNGDGRADIVAVNSSSVGTVNVLLGNGDGTFQPAKTSAAGTTPTSVAVGDLNGDGRTDLASPIRPARAS